MRVFIAILVLIFNLQSPIKAENISDFEIEGVSIGDSLLDYLSKNKIETTTYPVVRGGKEYKQYSKVPLNKKSSTYDRVLLFYKTDDPENIIQAIVGRNYYEDNIDECYSLQKNIVNELESIFTKGQKDDKGKVKNSAFPEGDSYKYDISFYFKDGSMAHTACYDFSIKDTVSKDRLSIGVYSKQYLEWFWSLK